jgi:hypothetical protein
MFCKGCKHYTPEKVPIDPFSDPSGELYGFTIVRLCTAGPDDICPAEIAMEQEDNDFDFDFDVVLTDADKARQLVNWFITRAAERELEFCERQAVGNAAHAAAEVLGEEAQYDAYREVMEA